MPKVKGVKPLRQAWSEENMREAIDNVKQKKMGWKLASRTFNVPSSTLRRRVGRNMEHQKGDLGGCRPMFSKEIEDEIVSHITNMETRFLGLTTADVRSLAYQVAERNHILHKFNQAEEKAGWAWLHQFIVRNPTISLRTPENTSAARAQAFNRNNIAAYFKKLDEVLTLHNFPPENVYNMDETGFSTVQTKPERIYATKGRKQVGSLTSAERGSHYTVVCAMNAVGSFIPPAFIFPRKNMKPELMDNAPAGSICFCQESGWMTSEVMLKWLNHFIRFAKPSPENKVLLLLDGHASHKHLSVLQKAKEHGIVLFCFPAHCTHRCQPLDIGFFGPLQIYYNQQIRLWLKAHPGRVVTHLQVAQIFCDAYLKAALPPTAIKAFQKTGIIPYCPNIFEDWMFAPAETTNRPLPSEENIGEPSNNSVGETREHLTPPSSPVVDFERPGPKEFKAFTQGDATKCKSKLSVSVQDISPLPIAPTLQPTTRKPRKKGKSGVINSTPDIEIEKAAEDEKQQKERAKFARAAKRKLKVIEERDEAEDENKENTQMDFEGIDDEEDVPCLYCNELFSWSKSKEMWLKCQSCGMWAHAACAGKHPRTKNFTCEICQ